MMHTDPGLCVANPGIGAVENGFNVVCFGEVGQVF